VLGVCAVLSVNKNKEKKMRKGWKQFISVCASLVVSLSAGAADINFDNGDGTMLWLTPANWAGDVLPGAGDVARAGTVGGTVTLNGPTTIGSMFWGRTGGAAVDVVTGGNLTSGSILIGDYSTTGVGELHVNGGTVSGSSLLRMGMLAGGNTGKFVLNSGTVTVTSGITSVGYSGTGYFDMTGGDFRGQNIYVAHLAGSLGTMAVSGGTLDLSQTLTVGNLGNGQLTVTGGALSSKGFSVGGANNTTSYAALLGGSITSTGATFNISANSELHIEGGTFIQKDNAVSAMNAYVAAELVTWTNGQAMLSETYTASWTNGNSVLYADFNNLNAGKTTFWVSPIPEPATVGLLAISGSVVWLLRRIRR
jgi:T5SS/PEP-CTERM-associated repeat protein